MAGVYEAKKMDAKARSITQRAQQGIIQFIRNDWSTLKNLQQHILVGMARNPVRYEDDAVFDPPMYLDNAPEGLLWPPNSSYNNKLHIASLLRDNTLTEAQFSHDY